MVIRIEHCGSYAESAERGKHIDPDIRLALETEIIAALQYDQSRALARKERLETVCDHE